jgi:hypothetical protein
LVLFFNYAPGAGLLVAPIFGAVGGLVLGLFYGLAKGLVESQSELVYARTPKEPKSRSLITALVWLVAGLLAGLTLGLIFGSVSSGGLVSSRAFVAGLGAGLVTGPIFGLVWGLNSGGWFLLLQTVAYRRLARERSLPLHPDDFLEWGIEKQIFRRVGSGVRFRHNLIQQHLASTSEGVS